ncbi:hypothetical protein HJG60_009611 [Phyllostomus discolor]|uniref:Uncharacterized protein n=1 Tax=Phyllostomus discolor TaxID=89673 RepID=A0A833Y3K1_9CHIR|nr:hypothetical protein HJG60_009611 [Phyllostomus discolor]
MQRETIVLSGLPWSQITLRHSEKTGRRQMEGACTAGRVWRWLPPSPRTASVTESTGSGLANSSERTGEEEEGLCSGEQFVRPPARTARAPRRQRYPAPPIPPQAPPCRVPLPANLPEPRRSG